MRGGHRSRLLPGGLRRTGGSHPGLESGRQAIASTWYSQGSDSTISILCRDSHCLAGVRWSDAASISTARSSTDGGGVEFVEFGPFATEPIRSNRERFNVWLLTDLLGDPTPCSGPDPPNGLGFGRGGGLLPDAQITAIELLPVGQWSGSEAGMAVVHRTRAGPPDRTDLQFAGAYVAVPNGIRCARPTH